MKTRLPFLLFIIFTLNFSAQNWNEIIKATASDGASQDQFGFSVAIDGNKAIVGSYLDDDNGSNSGSVYIFSFSNNIWTQEAKLTASDGAANDFFGQSVGISGDKAIVSAHGDLNNLANSGSAYIFNFDGNIWSEEQKIKASNPSSGDRFGFSVAISGDKAIISAFADNKDNFTPDSGSAYIYNFDGNIWSVEQKLIASDAAANNRFGFSVAISGDKAIIGSDNDDNIGSAYIFNFVNNIWTQEAKLIASDGATADGFGESVAISDDNAIIGAYGDDDNGSNSGSAYIFSFTNNTWSQEAKLTASDGNVGHYFGLSVGIIAGNAIVGAKYSSNFGAAYIYSLVNNVWTQEIKLTASDGTWSDNFGNSVGISGNKVIIGADFDDDNGSNSGSAYFYELGNTPPTTTNVTFAGTLEEGQLLSATYDYADVNNDTESGSTYKWYVSDDNAGLNKTAINGATNTTYTLTNTDIGKYISFEVTPNDGTDFGFAAESALQGPIQAVFVNTAPTATNVTFTGTLEEAQQLSATYTYSDANSDAESGSTYQWYVSDDNAGLNKIAINGATNTTYTLTNVDVGKYISFEVTPNDGTDFGIAVESALQGPIQAIFVNNVPTATNVTFTGTLEEAQLLSGTYDYSDANSDTESGSAYKWYVSDDNAGLNKAAINGATNQNYTLTNADIGKFISFEVTPNDGTDFGSSVESALQGPIQAIFVNTAPTIGTIRIDGTLKQGEEITAFYTYQDTENDPENGTTIQWYRSDQYEGAFVDVNRTLIVGATNQNYTLTNDDVGKYLSFEVTPSDGISSGVTRSTSNKGPVKDISIVPNLGGSWQTIGNESFSENNTDLHQITLDSNGTPYVAFLEQSNQGKIALKKFENNNWVNVGNSQIPEVVVKKISLSIDNFGVPYIALQKTQSNIDRIAVYKLENNNWEEVGDLSFLNARISAQSIDFDSNNVPYLAYRNEANSFKAGVLKFDGQNWQNVGTDGFTISSIYDISIGVDVTDVLHIVIADGSQGNDASVMKFDGNNWVYVGSPGFSEDQIFYPKIAFNANNTPYVVYTDVKQSFRTTVKTFNGTDWNLVGERGFSLEDTRDPTLVFDNNDVPYVGFSEGYDNPTSKTTVMKFTNNQWGFVGDERFLNGVNRKVDIDFDQNNKIFMVYSDGSNASKTTVKVINEIPVATNISVTGTLQIGEELTATYTYSDTDNDTENGSTYQWFRSEDANGTNKIAIPNATNTTYTLTSDDENKYISFQVTPNDGYSSGDAVESALQGPIQSILVPQIIPGNWQTVGVGGFSADNAYYQSLAIDHNNTSFIAFRDDANLQKISVMKFDDSSWIPLGNLGFSDGAITHPDLVISNDNIPFIAYKDEANGSKMTVMKFNGTDWVVVGIKGFTDGKAFANSLAFDNNNIPYVAYRDSANGSKTTVMKFNGTSWEPLGIKGFSEGSASDISLAIDNNNTPIVAYRDSANDSKTTVMTYNGANWVVVGNKGFSDGTTNFQSLAIDSNNTPYVAYRDEGLSLKTAVMKFDGNNWVPLGVKGVSQGRADFQSLVIDSNDNVYVAYADGTNSFKTRVLKYDGTNWFNVGSNGGSDGGSSYVSLAINNLDKLYIGYQDQYFQNFNKTTVKIFNENPSATNVSFTGTLELGEELTATYTYSDSDNDTENGSTYQWFRSEDANGTNKIAIPNATNTTYTLTSDDENKYISFQVTPRDGYSFGDAEESALQGPIQAIIIPQITGNWQTVGVAGFSDGVSQLLNLEIGSDETPFVAFRDDANSSKASVMQFDGINWEYVGMKGFTINTVTHLTLKLDNNNVPYVAYLDGITNKGNVLKFDGQNWVNVGIPNFSDGGASYFKMEFDNDNNPYVVFSDLAPANQGLTVMKFNGNNWEVLGVKAFTTDNVSHIDFKIDSSNIPIVSFPDHGVSDRISVMKYNGANWEFVGNAGFSSGQVLNTALALDNNDKPYVIFRDYSNLEKATIMSFDGVNWNNIGSPSPNGFVGFVDIIIDNDNNPIISFCDLCSSFDASLRSNSKSSVMKYNNNEWKFLGDQTFSNNQTSWQKLSLSPNNKLFFAFTETINGSKPTVKIFNENPTATNVTFSGTLETGQELTATYAYSDSDNDAENGSTFQWFRSDDINGTNKIAIPNATNAAYILTSDDENKYISFQVTPNDGYSFGDTVESALQGPVNEVNTNGTIKVIASDGTERAYFGGDVAIYGDYAIVGAYGDLSNKGAAYIYKRSGENWIEETKLTASDGAANQLFGGSVAIFGDYAVVGAHYNHENGYEAGAAYVFKRTGNTWVQEAKLLASDGGISDRFGISVDINGEYVVVGALYDDDNGSNAGAAYIFKRTGSTWSQETKLISSDGDVDDIFGLSVSIEGSYAIVGARFDDDNGAQSGSAYIFKRSGTNWSQEAKLLASNGAEGDLFGNSVSIHGDYALVGSWADDEIAHGSGAAYLFKRSGINWILESKLTASDASESDGFGVSVAIDERQIVVGTLSSESSYIFKLSNGTWIEESKLIAYDQGILDGFGRSVAIHGNFSVIGAFGDDDIGDYSGATYFFKIENNTLPIATNVTFSGILEVGQELSATYDYTDADTNPENGSTYKWYASDDNAGLNKSAINGSTNTTYTLTNADIGKYISFEVTPNDGSDFGIAVESSLQGSVSAIQVNTISAAADAISIQQNSANNSIPVLNNDDYGSNGIGSVVPLKFTNGSIASTTANGGVLFVGDNGTASEYSDDVILYSPAVTFTGIDVFEYVITDSSGNESTANVTVTVNAAVNTLAIPTSQPDTAIFAQNSTDNVIDVIDNDDFGSDGAIDNGLTLPNGQISGPSDLGGTVSVDDKGTASPLDDEILYTPKSGFIGSDIFRYMITDTSGDTSISIVTITVTEIDTPTATADGVSVLQDSGATPIDVLANDSFGSDGPGAIPLTLPLAVSDQGGTIVVNAGKVAYSPLGGFSGTDTFEYTIEDATGDVSTATVTVTVGLVNSNDAPTAQNDAVTVIQNSIDNPISILLNNGSGADDYGSDGPNTNHPIALSQFYTDHGAKLVLVGEVVNYTPRIGFVGVDTFSYTITDTTGDADRAIVTVTVGEITTPTAVADAATVAQDSGATPIDVLANDSFGADGQGATPLTLALATSTAGGTIVVNAGKVAYTPLAGFSGTDTFEYTIEDGSGDTTSATVKVVVEATVVAASVFTAKADAISVVQNSTTSLNVFADNGSGADSFGAQGALDDGLTLIDGNLSGNSEQGTISIVTNGTPSPLDDVIEYTPNTGYVGVDHFYYMIHDATGATAIAQVTVTVTEQATPTAVADAVTVAQDSGATPIDVLANDSFGLDGAGATPITLPSATSTAGGTIVVNAGKVDYTPLAGFDGTDTFDYIITDASGDTATAIVTVTVDDANTGDTPSAQDDAVSVLLNSTNNVINILDDNGSGADSFGSDGPIEAHNPISLFGAQTDKGGDIVIVGNTIEYTPKTGFTGIDKFRYRITDKTGDASQAEVIVTITLTKSQEEGGRGSSSFNKEFAVFPNPSKGDINISVFSDKNEQVSTLLFDVTGKVVYRNQYQLSIGKNVIDLNLNVKAGIIFLKVYSKETNYGFKKIVFK
ncbi:Ig-like domain-containing protein [Polaribacter sp. Hel_I_88]|uniref:Ig-like domain-containing protein n=1 Tax=Polaribacter sp. Hel_I_88 TaxID=1250006 RepID=UPI00055B76F0|nr:Ig-like domain-containing protein [Polaribacter sp. Hel_I_88]